MSSKRQLHPEEARAWARVARTVRPIGHRDDDLSVFESALEAGEPLRKRPSTGGLSTGKHIAQPLSKPVGQPADRGTERRVRRGKLVLHAQFDLHGHTQASAEAALNRFLQRCRTEGARCVLVITGKGRGGDGVLRRNFLNWVQGPQASHLVSGYSQAHQRHGGSGAFYLFLRKSD